MNHKVIAVFAVLCCTTASAFLNFGGGKSKDLAVLEECSKDKKCAAFCVAKKLNYTSDNGNINTTQIPFYDGLKTFGVDSCVTKNTQTDKCEKYNSIKTCIRESASKALKESSKKCSEESKIPEFKPDISSVMKIVTNPKSIKCYVKCMLLSFKIIGEDNLPRTEVFEKGMKEKGYKADDVKAILKKCGEKNSKGDECDRVTNIAVCVGKEAVTKFGLSKLTQFKSLIM